jgi:hypothetical protein
MRTAILLAIAVLSAGCDRGAVTSPQNAPTGIANPQRNTTQHRPNDKLDARKPPAEDLDAWRKVKAPTPNGWSTVRKADCHDLLRRVRRPPEEFQFVGAVSSTKAPGQTDGEVAWIKWSAQTTAAILYHAGKQQQDPAQAVIAHAAGILTEAGAAQTQGEIAWAKSGDGRALLAALQNQHGTYVVIGLLPADDAGQNEKVILEWAAATKP